LYPCRSSARDYPRRRVPASLHIVLARTLIGRGWSARATPVTSRSWLPPVPRHSPPEGRRGRRQRGHSQRRAGPIGPPRGTRTFTRGLGRRDEHGRWWHRHDAAGYAAKVATRRRWIAARPRRGWAYTETLYAERPELDTASQTIS